MNFREGQITVDNRYMFDSSQFLAETPLGTVRALGGIWQMSISLIQAAIGLISIFHALMVSCVSLILQEDNILAKRAETLWSRLANKPIDRS